MYKTCLKCRGKGSFIIRKDKVTCPKCEGIGFVNSPEPEDKKNNE